MSAANLETRALAASGEAQAPDDYEWTETDWASDAPDAYTRSKVDTERFINAAADASDGRWDAITMNPAMICGPHPVQGAGGGNGSSRLDGWRRPPAQLALKGDAV